MKRFSPAAHVNARRRRRRREWSSGSLPRGPLLGAPVSREGRTGRGSLTLRSHVARRRTDSYAWERRARDASPLHGPRVNAPDSVRPPVSREILGGPGAGGPGERVPCRRALTSAGRADCGAPGMLYRGRRGEDAWNTRDRSPQAGPGAHWGTDHCCRETGEACLAPTRSSRQRPRLRAPLHTLLHQPHAGCAGAAH